MKNRQRSLKMDDKTRTRAMGVIAIIGGVLIHLTYGNFYTVANMASYIMSYLKMYIDNDVQSNLAVWLSSGCLACQGIVMPFGGIIARKYGFRFILLISFLLQSGGIALTYFAIKQSFIFVVLTYAMLNGFGVGLGYAVVIAVATTWFPENRGLVVGLIVGGFGMGALIFTPIQTAFINPDNVKVDKQTRFFTDPGLLERVPYAFILIGGILGAIQIIGLLLLRPKPSGTQTEKDPENDQVKEKKKETRVSLRPLQVLRCVDFYLLWFVFFFCIIPTSIVASGHKLFAQKYISEDLFLSAIVTMSSIFNTIGRVFWGFVVDKLSFKVPIILVLLLWISVLFTFPHIGLVGDIIVLKALYATWVCLIFIAVCGSFAIMPAAMASMFGAEYLAINFGMLFTAVSAGGVISGIAAHLMSSGDTYVYQFTGCGVCCVLGLLVAVWIDDRRMPKRINVCSWFTAQCHTARRPVSPVAVEAQPPDVETPAGKCEDTPEKAQPQSLLDYILDLLQRIFYYIFPPYT